MATFMWSFRKAYTHVKKIMNSGDSDALGRAKYYLELKHLQETIILPDLKEDSDRIQARFRMFGKSAIFTNIMDMKAEEIMDLCK